MRDDPPEEMSVEEYLKLEEKSKPKKKAQIKKPRKPADPPVYCVKCKKRITGNHSTANPVKDGKTEHYHWWCYYGEENES